MSRATRRTPPGRRWRRRGRKFRRRRRRSRDRWSRAPSCCYPAAMESTTYHVQADWDPEAAVWVATSADVPGLATEAETIEGLTDRLRTMIPELLEANGLLHG